MDILKFFDENEVPITIIPEERKYWLVRTQSGEFYDEFYHDNFIGIGWDEFCDIDHFRDTDKDTLVAEIEKMYKSDSPDKQGPQPGRIYGQIYRFLFDLKIGDIVMIPSTNSTHISFGVITSNPYIAEITEAHVDAGLCSFKKRRNVKWMKTVQRNKLDPYLYRMMQTHHTISNADEYEHFIDRTLHAFYMKNKKVHFVIDIQTQKEISAVDLITYVSTFLELVPFIENKDDPNGSYSHDDIELKINVQSPGVIEFSSMLPYLMAIVGILVVGLVGGSIKFSNKRNSEEDETNLELQSEGIFEKVLKFVKQRDSHQLSLIKEKNKMLQKKLDAKLPKEITKKLDQ